MSTHNTSSLSLARRWAAAALLAGVAAGAVAQTATPTAATTAAPQAMTAPSTQRMNIGQIYDVLTKAGYQDVREIEWSDGRYEAKARTPQGERVKLDLDGRTGAVLRSRIKH